MPVYRLTEDLVFPHPTLAREDGLLAVGGDLSPDRLLLAYSNGIFPWYSAEDPLLWWSPHPRCILFPKDLKISKSMRKFLRKNRYRITFDTVFHKVIAACGTPREETWLSKEMMDSYCILHELGLAHSVETWYGEELVGGLYGISLGNCFFGESMFSTMDNASKTALFHLIERFEFSMIDCQVYSKHLESLGAVNVHRDEFLKLLYQGLKYKTLKSNWRFLNNG